MSHYLITRTPRDNVKLKVTQLTVDYGLYCVWTASIDGTGNDITAA